MILVKTFLRASKIEGIGIFAGEFIPKGTPVWMRDTQDRQFTYNEVEKMRDSQKEFILKYAYTEDGKYILCSDDSRFMNHSPNPNTESFHQFEIASRDIRKGEEITCNYFKINDDHSREIFKQLKIKS